MMIDGFPLANDRSVGAPRDMDRLAETFAAAALEAGPAILAIYADGPRVRLKADRSPVCDADEAAETIILAALAKTCPGLPVVAEEAVSRGEIPSLGDDFILVDPLDGTREFLSRNGEFTVNIAFVRNGAPRCGVVYAPALNLLWIGGTSARAIGGGLSTGRRIAERLAADPHAGCPARRTDRARQSLPL